MELWKSKDGSNANFNTLLKMIKNKENAGVLKELIEQNFGKRMYLYVGMENG